MLFGCIELPADSEQVIDADEEVFILYTTLQTQLNAPRGLGQYDATKDLLDLEINDNTEIRIAQDKTRLRTRKGDTGSVLWQASVDIGRTILRNQPNPLLNAKDLDVLELGAGIGLLGIILAPLVKTYQCTDLPYLIPLIQKNISLNSPLPNLLAEPLDWACAPQCFRPSERKPDLIIAVDVLYHPSLVPSLLKTIDYLSERNRTTVLIAAELRSHDVIQEFLEKWLQMVGWKIWRMGSWGLEGPYACWVGSRDDRVEVAVE